MKKKIIVVISVFLILLSFTSMAFGDTRYSYTDAVNRIKFETDDPSFDLETSFKVLSVKVDEGTKLEEVLNKLSEEYILYYIDPQVKGQSIDLKSRIKITMPLPALYGRNVTVYYIKDDGSREELPLIIDTTTMTLQMNMKKDGYYAVINLNKVPVLEDPQDVSKIPVEYYLYGVIAILFILMVVFAILYVKKDDGTKFKI